MNIDSLIQQYEEGSADQKFELLFNHYKTFLQIIDISVGDLLRDIELERDYCRRQEIGDLGVRVQGSGMHSDLTGDQGTNHVLTREAIINCNFPREVLDGIPNKAIFVRRAYMLRMMRWDYEMFSDHLAYYYEEKGGDDLKKLMESPKSMSKLASEICITTRAYQKRILRIKMQVKEDIIPKLKQRYQEIA